MKSSRFVRGLSLLVMLSIILYGSRVALYGSLEFGYMLWNLLLAAIPLAVVLYLDQRLTKGSWLDSPNLILTGVWLAFLPNSFYIVTDLIHIAEVGPGSRLLTSVMLLTFAIAGLILGYASVLMVHRQLRVRLRARSAGYVIALVFLLCSYAIYLGRYMRWNTWDMIINPIGLLSNIADSLVVPREGAPMLETTLLFFGFIGILYVTVLQFFGKAAFNPITSGKRRPKKVK